MADLTRKQIYATKGRLKGPVRAAGMARRYERRMVTMERKYQENLAREILRRI